MSQKDYKRYVAEGPDSLNLSAVTAALDWKSENPTEAFAIRARHEATMWEAENREMLQETWIRDGGDVSQFAAAYKELSAEQRKEKVRRMEEEGHAASWRSHVRGF